MAWVITNLCRERLDMSCVEVCPVDCIVQYQGSDGAWPNQLFIDPEECINCGVCEAECPWEAIFEDEAVPAVFSDAIALNASVAESRDQFAAPEKTDATTPTAGEVSANKEKWGYSG